MSFNRLGLADVDYEEHFAQYAKPNLIAGNAENNRFFEREAQENHALAVSQALDELLTDALLLLPIVHFKQLAEHHFRFGVMRRLRMIQENLRSFRSLVWPQREEPLTQEQSDRVCRDLNALYIDMLGILDNYAFVLVLQFGSVKTQATDPMRIGLFKSAFRADFALEPVAAQMANYADWEREVKMLRNPAAHRIPLYVPSAAFTADDMAQHERLSARAFEAQQSGNFDEANTISTQTWAIGTFRAQFLHDPEGPILDIFPTLPGDIGKTIAIGRIVQSHLRLAQPS